MSCDTCVHRVSDFDIKDVVGAMMKFGPGVDYCSKKHLPLGRPNMPPEQRTEVKVMFGKSCDVRDDPPLPSNKIKGQPTSLIGTPTVFPTPRPDGVLAPADCSQCHHYLDPGEVQKYWGWEMGGCLAKGILIPTRQVTQTARDCGFGVHNAADLHQAAIDPEEGFNLLPVYGSATVILKTNAATSSISPQPDPSVFMGDRAATAEDEAKGIRCWRKFEHPTAENKAAVWWPVFEPYWEGFTDLERESIPQTGGSNHPELYVDHQNLMYYVGAAYANRRSPVLIGQAGTGKTEFFRYAAWLCQMPYTRIPITSSSSNDDLMGKYLVTVDEGSHQSVTDFALGALPKLWERAGIVCIDEPNLGPKEVVERVRPLIDSDELLSLIEDLGQNLPRNEFRFLGFAMNPSWDLRYQGTNDMNEADLGRMAPFEVDYPEPNVERSILCNVCNANGFDITNEDLDLVMAMTEDMREASAPITGSLGFSWGMRIMIGVALGMKYYTLTEAVRFALADRLDPDEKATVMAFAKTHDTAGVR